VTFQLFVSRCRRCYPALTQSLWLSSLFVLVVLAVLLFMPAGTAAPIVVDDQFDFATSSFGWVATPVAVAPILLPPLDKRWKHDDLNSNRWTVVSSDVSSKKYWSGNHLTSGTINVAAQLPDGAEPVDTIRLSVVHAFNLPFGTQAYPIAAGQITYSINGGAFQEIQAAWFQQGTVASVDAAFPPADPTWSKYLNPQTQTLVTPTYVPGADIPLLKTGGASFVGTSLNAFTWLVPSVAVIPVDESITISSVQFRFTNANLGGDCPPNAGWQLALVQSDFYALPEPGAIVTAAMGIAFLAIRAWPRRGHRITTSLRGPA